VNGCFSIPLISKKTVRGEPVEPCAGLDGGNPEKPTNWIPAPYEYFFSAAALP